jgi:hypothetical protein
MDWQFWAVERKILLDDKYFLPDLIITEIVKILKDLKVHESYYHVFRWELL